MVIGFRVRVNQYFVSGNHHLCGSVVMKQDFKICRVVYVKCNFYIIIWNTGM